LILCDDFVEKQGEKIRVESESEKGVIFILDFNKKYIYLHFVNKNESNSSLKREIKH